MVQYIYALERLYHKHLFSPFVGFFLPPPDHVDFYHTSEPFEGKAVITLNSVVQAGNTFRQRQFITKYAENPVVVERKRESILFYFYSILLSKEECDVVQC